MPKVEIRLDTASIARVSREAQAAALETVAALRGEVITAQVIPFDYGTLQNSMGTPTQTVREAEIVTTLAAGGGDAPYGRRLYFHPEYNFQTANNPNARGLWLEPWLTGGEHANFIPDTFQSRLKARLDK